MKRYTIRFCLLTACLLLVGNSAFAAETKYNVLFIAVDDMRPELNCYGNAMVKTPNMDRLAKEGLLFNRAYCQFALCNPTRASLLTGRRPETTKIYNLETFFRKNLPDVVTIPQLFKQNGYQALNFGKIFHNSNGNHDDPASWSKPPWHSLRDDSKTVKTTSAASKQNAEKDPDAADHSNDLPAEAPDVGDDDLHDGQTVVHALKAMGEVKDVPFFLAVGFHRPHLPFVAPKKYWDLYDPQKISLAPNPFHPKDAPAFANNDASELRRYKGIPKKGLISDDVSRNLIHGYYASISYVDTQVGRLLTELDRLKLRDKTIVILWGDHGYQLGEHATWNKRTDWEIATRVPLLISVPGQKSVDKKTDALVEFVDIYPTLTELCHLPMPAGLEGTSFVPLLDNDRQSWKTAAFSIYSKKIPELGEGAGFGRAMRTDRYRFIEWSVKGSDKRAYELYDHQKDPQENVNIANLPENKTLVATLSQQLKKGWKGALPPK